MSFHKGFSEFLDKHLNTRGILLGRMSARSGDIKCVEDLFISAMDPAGFEPSDGDAASSLPVTDAGPSNRTATKEAKAKVDDLRRQMNNTVAAAARVSVDEDLVNAMRMVALGTRPEDRAFSRMMKYLKGAADSEAYYYEQAQWEYLRWCKETLNSLTDAAALGRCGFTVHFPTNTGNRIVEQPAGAVRRPPGNDIYASRDQLDLQPRGLAPRAHPFLPRDVGFEL